jgi:hypothetical protein
MRRSVVQLVEFVDHPLTLRGVAVAFVDRLDQRLGR